MRLFFFALIMLNMAVAAQALPEPDSHHIIAIVNDDVISSRDFSRRLILTATTLKAPPDASQRRAMERSVLQGLINEQLKLQEATRLSINVSPSEIDTAITRLEKQQNLSEGAITQKLQAAGIPVTILREQLRADLAWQKLLSRQVRRNITVTDKEIDQARIRVARGRKNEQVQVASVILPVPDNTKASAKAVLPFALELRERMLAGDSAQDLLARFEGRTTLEYGPLSWVESGLMNPDLRETIRTLEPGDIAEPVLTPAGWQVVRVMDRRMVGTMPEENAEVTLKEIVLKLSEASLALEIEAMMDIARNIAKHPGSCTENSLAGMNNIAGLNIEVDYVRAQLAEMPQDLRHMVEPLSVTGITEPFAAPDGIHLLMLCEKMAMPLPEPDRERVRAVLMEEKLRLEAEKYMRRLRREAFIDVRA